jgi:5-methylcytosine-specific restriction endonuclease McrA
LQYTKNQIIPNSDAIREKLLQLMTNNEKFRDSILIKTSGKEEMRIRFEIWNKALREIMDGTTTERMFSGELKNRLFNIDPTCQLCKQQVQSIDDCEIDHILPYSQ